MTPGTPRTLVARWGLGAALVGAVLAIGSLDTGVLCAVVGVLAVLLALSWGTGERMVPRAAATRRRATRGGGLANARN